MIAPEVAYDKLSNYKSAEDLREFFADEGIKGIIGHASMCPIATWLVDTTQIKNVTVAGSIKFYKDMVENEVDAYPHTEATEQFVKNFDSRCYPELIKEEGPILTSDYWYAKKPPTEHLKGH